MGPVALAAISALSNPETMGRTVGWVSSLFDPSAKAYRRQLKEDRQRLARNDFGLSEAEKNAQMAAAMRMQQAGARDIETDLQRQAAATGFGRSAVATQAQRDLGQNLASSAGEMRGEIEKYSSDLADQRKQQALARIKARREESRKRAEEAGQTAGTAVKDFAAAKGRLSGLGSEVQRAMGEDVGGQVIGSGSQYSATGNK